MTRYLLLLLVVLSLGACHKDSNVGPANLLFQRWQLVQSKRIGDQSWTVHDLDVRQDTEYRSDGILLYRLNGAIQPPQCCSGNQFRRDGQKISYSDFISCPTALCVSVQSVVIQQLTDNQLELNDGTYIRQYRSVRY
jgi:hypothetical protein